MSNPSAADLRHFIHRCLMRAMFELYGFPTLLILARNRGDEALDGLLKHALAPHMNADQIRELSAAIEKGPDDADQYVLKHFKRNAISERLMAKIQDLEAAARQEETARLFPMFCSPAPKRPPTLLTIRQAMEDIYVEILSSPYEEWPRELFE